jgi:hypothetical protein
MRIFAVLSSAYSCFTRCIDQAGYANNGDQLALASGFPMSDNEYNVLFNLSIVVRV